MRLIIQPNYDEVSEWVANYVVKRINDFAPTAEKPFVLGLPTGSSPKSTYARLAELHKMGRISFLNVIT
jgi:glucosamine-6-phosphate deaminase